MRRFIAILAAIAVSTAAVLIPASAADIADVERYKVKFEGKSPLLYTGVDGFETPATFRFRNIGTISWEVGGDVVMVATSSPRNGLSSFQASDWDAPTRPSRIDLNLSNPGKRFVDPGESALFKFNFRNSPDAHPGECDSSDFELVAELPGETYWIPNSGMSHGLCLGDR